jgi:hypothetical protein
VADLGGAEARGAGKPVQEVAVNRHVRSSPGEVSQPARVARA